MTVNKKLQVWLPLLFCIVMVLGILTGYQLQKNMSWKSKFKARHTATSVEQVMELVRLRFVDSLNIDSMEAKGINAIVNLLDPHSAYLTPNKVNEESARLQGNFSGMGIDYIQMQDTVNLVYVIENSPADKAGLKIGDQLLKLDTTIIAGTHKTGEQLRGLMRGKSGTSLKVEYLRNGQPFSTSLIRANLPLLSLDAAYMAAPGIGYIKLNKFAETTYREFMDAATGLQAKGMKKMILDLRGNGGGLLEQATNIADELLADGRLMVSTRGANIKTREIRSVKPGIFEDGPLVVLIDEMSASASEVLVGALQDNDRGVIVGRRSYGKGLVQEQYDLANGGALRLTVARYYTPLGRCIQRPYELGQREKYQKEIQERINHGDTSTDGKKFTQKEYTTRKGKKLYDGGGITPDILVSIDTTPKHPIVNSLQNEAFLQHYVFNLYNQEQAILKQMGDPAKVAAQYQLPPSTWPNLVAAAQKEGKQLKIEDTKAKLLLEDMIKSRMIRYIWRTNGLFQASNPRDPIFIKGLHTIESM